jgi:hypothetical protein
MIPCNRVNHCRSSLPCSIPGSFSSLASSSAAPSGILPARIRDHAQHRRQRVAVQIIQGITETGDLPKFPERLVTVHISDGLHFRIEQDPLLHVEDALLRQILAQIEEIWELVCQLPSTTSAFFSNTWKQEGSARLTPSTARVIREASGLRHSSPRLAKAWRT